MSQSDVGCNPFTAVSAKRRPLWQRFAVWGAILLTLVPLVILSWRIGQYLVWRNAAQRWVDAEVARLKNIGEPLTAEELHHFHQVPSGVLDLTNAWREALSDLEAIRPDPHGAEYAALPLIGVRDLDELESDAPDSCLVETEAYLQRIAPQIEAILTLTSQRGEVRFPVKFEDHIAAQLPHVQSLAHARKVLLIRARASQIRGNFAELHRTLSALAALPHALDRSYSVIEQLGRCAACNDACKAITEAANRGGLSDAQLRQLESQLAELEFTEQAVRALTGERVMNWGAMDASAMLVTGNEDYITRSIRRAGPLDRAFFLDASARSLAAASVDYRKANLELSQLKLELQEKRGLPGLERMHYAYSAMLLNYDANVGFYNSAARCTIARAVLLAHVFRDHEKRWPHGIEEIEGSASEPLVDPFTGEALKLRQAGEGLVIYSVGSDLFDDGGNEPESRFRPDIVGEARAAPASSLGNP